MEEILDNLENPNGFVLSPEERQDIIDETLTYLNETDGMLKSVDDSVTTIETDGVTNAKKLVDESLATQIDATSKEILNDFDFGTTDYAGAVKSGNLLWNQTTGAITSGSGVAVYRKGIVGASGGVATFTLDATTGNATFAGTLSSAGGTFTGTLSGVNGTFSGTISGSTISGGTVTGSTIKTSTGTRRIEMTSANQLNFYYDNDFDGQITSESDGDLRIWARRDIKLRTGNTSTTRIKVENTYIHPDVDDSYDLGSSSYQWENCYVSQKYYVEYGGSSISGKNGTFSTDEGTFRYQGGIIIDEP